MNSAASTPLRVLVNGALLVFSGACNGWMIGSAFSSLSAIFWMCAHLIGIITIRERSVVALLVACSSIPFYGLALRSILFTNGGVLGSMWMTFALFISLVHVVFWLCIHAIQHGRHPGTCAMMFPVFWTFFEWIRHIVIRAVDGNGCTMLAAGLGLADCPYVRPLAALGGIWLLTSVLATLAGCCFLLFSIRLRRSHDFHPAAAVLGCFLVISLTLGILRYRSPMPVRSRSQTIALVGEIYYPYVMAGVVDQLQSRHSSVKDATTQKRIILFPETSLLWKEADFGENEVDILRVSRENPRDTLVLGTKYRWPDGKLANAVVVVREGKIISARNKVHPVIFLERPSWFAGLIFGERASAFAAQHQYAAEVPMSDEVDLEQTGGLLPTICYDIFFSDSTSSSGLENPSLLSCGLDESRDPTGTMAKLSVQASKLRAVEQGTSVLRASLGGWSGILNCRGDWEAGPVQLSANSPYLIAEHSVAREATFFQRFGESWVLINNLTGFGVVLFWVRNRRRIEPSE